MKKIIFHSLVFLCLITNHLFAQYIPMEDSITAKDTDKIKHTKAVLFNYSKSGHASEQKVLYDSITIKYRILTDTINYFSLIKNLYVDFESTYTTPLLGEGVSTLYVNPLTFQIGVLMFNNNKSDFHPSFSLGMGFYQKFNSLQDAIKVATDAIGQKQNSIKYNSSIFYVTETAAEYFLFSDRISLQIKLGTKIFPILPKDSKESLFFIHVGGGIGFYY